VYSSIYALKSDDTLHAFIYSVILFDLTILSS
jgi:hypothetical protein